MILDSNLFPALLVGSVAGAGLTLTGAGFLVECIDRQMQDRLLQNYNLISINEVLKPLMIQTFATVILFLLSGLVFLVYSFNNDAVLFVSFVLFLVSITVFLLSCLSYGLPNI